MVDFQRLRGPPARDPTRDPIEIFQTLPKPEHINDLWDTQAAALRDWHRRRSERDLVIKLNTGSGKTLVGLLIGESVRRELQQPVLYLAPTIQLATQVVQKATESGIPAEAYQSRHGLPASFVNAKAILVGSYQMLFNGLTVFGLRGRGEPVAVGGIVLDDAHTSAAVLRDQFSIIVRRSEHEELYRDLVGQFRSTFEMVHAIGTLDTMLAGRDEGVMEVPHWAWLDAAPTVRTRIQSEDDDRFRFNLPLVRDHFEFSHALISNDAFTITPLLPPVDLVPSFADCDRRVFMSATLADDGLLVRTFGASAESMSKPITTRSVAGLGERMILAPTLSDLSRDSAVAAARRLADQVRQQGKGAVVLVPSRNHAKDWQDVGKVCVGNAVEAAVERLQQPTRRGETLPVLVNRYDGIDLPHDSCRLLILDGRPLGSNHYDLYRASVLPTLSSTSIAQAQKVEQGMGRGTRGAGDYCVVLLLGADLVAWLGQNGTQQTLTPGTRAQVVLGREIANQVKSPGELVEAAWQCLERNGEWQQTHAQRIAEAGEVQANAEQLVAAGRVERRAFEKMLHQQFAEACDFLTRQAQDAKWNDEFRGWLLQLASRAAWLANDGNRADLLQKEAYSSNRNLTKPRADIRYQPLARGTPQATNVVEIVEGYAAMRSAVLDEIDTALAALHAEATANRFEQAIQELGRFLGLTSERPEKRRGAGPDNLWLGDGKLGFVIECKHMKTTPVNKADHGQLSLSEKWFRRHYPAWRGVAIIVHRDGRATAQSGAVESDTRVLTIDALGRIKSALKAIYRDLAFLTTARADQEARAAALLRRHSLDSRLATEYLAPFQRSAE